MATTLYLRSEDATTSLGDGHTTLYTSDSNHWIQPLALSTSAGSSYIMGSAYTLSGGQEIRGAGGCAHWLSEPLAAGVTISGTITFRVCGNEDDMKANAAFGVKIEKVSAVDFSKTTVSNSMDDAEMSSTLAAHTWTATPTSTAFAKGDRIRITVYIDDAPGLTMATGFTCNMYASGASSGPYDTYVQFNEDLTFMTFSGAQYLYPTKVASDVSTTDVDYKLWTSRGT